MKKTNPKVALVYDRVNTPYGGAENVLLALQQIYPQAPLFTSVYDSERARWAKNFSVRPSFLQRIPGAARFHRLWVWLMPLAFESLDLSKFDVVISISSAEAKGVLTKPHQLHICYLLTPTRYLWSHALEYQQHWLTGILRKLVFNYLRWWDRVAALRPDVYIPISQIVSERCQEYYLRQAAPVIYPTVGEIASFCPNSSSSLSIEMLAHDVQAVADKYYLIVSRLVPYKKIDLAIKACQMAQKPLVIIGQGPDLKRLQNLAHANAKVIFLQAVQDSQLPAYYAHCQAFLAPAEEDFGITVIEAQHLGKPVVVYAKSGAAEVVQEGTSGIHFLAQTVTDLSEALHIVSSHTWDKAAISQEAKQWCQANFQQEFKKAVKYYWQRHQTKGRYDQ